MGHLLCSCKDFFVFIFWHDFLFGMDSSTQQHGCCHGGVPVLSRHTCFYNEPNYRILCFKSTWFVWLLWHQTGCFRLHFCGVFLHTGALSHPCSVDAIGKGCDASEAFSPICSSTEVATSAEAPGPAHAHALFLAVSVRIGYVSALHCTCYFNYRSNLLRLECHYNIVFCVVSNSLQPRCS